MGNTIQKIDYTFLKLTEYGVDVKIGNEVVKFEKKEQTDSYHIHTECFFMDGFVKGDLKFVCFGEFEKNTDTFLLLDEIEKY